VAGELLEFEEIPADDHAEAEGGDLTGPGDWGQDIAVFDGEAALFELLAIEAGIGPVTGTDVMEEAAGTGAEAEEGEAAPVGDVVLAGEGWERAGVIGEGAGEVSDFVLDEVVVGGGVEEGFVHGAGEVVIDVEFTGLELMIEGGIFLVDDFVAGEGGEELCAGVDAAEAFEEMIVEGLDAHGDAVDAGLAEETGFIEGESGGVDFYGPLGGGKGEGKVEGGEELFPLADIEKRGGAAADEESMWAGREGAEVKLQFEGGDGAIDEVGAGFGVEGAIVALTGAEGDMDIKAMDRPGRGG